MPSSRLIRSFIGLGGLGVSTVLSSFLFLTTSQAQQPASEVAIDSDDIGGVVSGPQGPEAGVWVIAETRDLPVRYIKSVVTDDRGRFVVPDLPQASYQVWARGYGLVDSAKATAKPGQRLNITATVAPNEAAAAHYGAKALRDVDLATLDAGAAGLDATVFRRARHVVTENARTLAAAQALAQSDWQQLAVLMEASHASRRDDFEITTPALDGLVEIIRSAIGTHGGVRMTGGGFGGCVVALTSQSLAATAMARVAEQYRSPAGHAAVSYLCQASAGAGPLAAV